MSQDTPLLLLVDDEENFRDIFATKFASSGFRVAIAANGEEGIAKAKTLQPDLILMDVKMPGMDGATALSHLKDDPQTKNIKVLFLTSLGDSMPDVQAMNDRLSRQSGAEGYLKKTDDLDHLIAQVKSHIS